ncbi:hypothetical protein [Flavobacterium sp.]|uniref:hypothetical protein n=1 Tax=Flavobacterium sp. TaxID=239 RepID=UPI00286E1D44|nr:hypothetical protein [Flavobacterium sp.]
MKNLVIKLLLIFTVLSSCSDKDDFAETIKAPEIHPQLRNLKKPTVILNTIETGLFNSIKINSIHSNNYNDTPRQWKFETFPDTNRIQKIITSNPNYLCAISTDTFYYENDLISKIISIENNVCLEFSLKREYTYHYDQNVLMSIFAKYYYSDAKSTNVLGQIGENHFSYNSDGTIAEIYSDIRPGSDPTIYGYQKKTLIYDKNKNVIEVNQEEYNSSTYDRKYIFEYDENINPLKGIYIFSAVIGGMPNYGFESSLGPIFLSNNCIKSVRSENLNHPNNFNNIQYFTTTISNKKGGSFGSEMNYQYWFRCYIN